MYVEKRLGRTARILGIYMVVRRVADEDGGVAEDRGGVVRFAGDTIEIKSR